MRKQSVPSAYRSRVPDGSLIPRLESRARHSSRAQESGDPRYEVIRRESRRRSRSLSRRWAARPEGSRLSKVDVAAFVAAGTDVARGRRRTTGVRPFEGLPRASLRSGATPIGNANLRILIAAANDVATAVALGLKRGRSRQAGGDGKAEGGHQKERWCNELLHGSPSLPHARIRSAANRSPLDFVRGECEARSPAGPSAREQLSCRQADFIDVGFRAPPQHQMQAPDVGHAGARCSPG